MGRHAVHRSRTVLSLVAAGSVLALGAGVLSVTGAATADGVKLSANLVSNPDFEAGTSGWDTQSTKTRLSIGSGHESKQSGTVTALAAGQALLLNDHPNVVRSATKGAKYLASVWVRSETRLGAALRFREVDRAGAYVGKSQTYAVITGDAWVQLKAEYVALGQGDQIAVQVVSSPAAKGVSISIDDVDVRQVLTSAAEEKVKTVVAKPSATASPAPSASASARVEATPEPSQSSEAPKQSEQPAVKPDVTRAATVFGEAMWMSSGETWAQTLSRLEGQYGRLGMVRAYYAGLPGAWTSGILGATGNRPVNVSFKALPRDILDGKYDQTFRQWFAAAPSDRKVWWTYYHEPEDNIKNGEFTAADYRDAWRRLADIADQYGPSNLKATLVLMDWSLSPKSGRDWKDYYPGSDYIDVLGWDGYNTHGSKPTVYMSPEDNFGRAVAVSKAEGKPFGYAEWGSQVIPGDDGSGRAKWMLDTAAYFRSMGADFAAYFDAPVGNDYRLLDQPSKDALRTVMAGDG